MLRKYSALVLVAAIAVVVKVKGQVEQSLQEKQETPPFYFDALVFAGDDTARSRLDVYVQVPYQSLQFVRNRDGYIASYEESISIYDAENDLVTEKIAVERVRLESFAETVHPARHNMTQRFFRLAPGTYSVRVRIRDEETNKISSTQRTVNVRRLWNSMLTMSDIMLVSRLQTDGEKTTIVPNITGNVANLPGGFYLFSEIYNATDCDSLDLSYHVRNAKNQETLSERLSYPVVSGKNQIFVRVNSATLPMGKYTVGLQAVACEHSGEERYATPLITHPFVIHWAGIPESIKDLDLAIDQIVYKAESKEIEFIKSAPTLEEKRKRFLEFWKKYDPNPLTERNEALEEYYRRVEIANRNFSHYREGWRTDRGMVFIMFGSPSSIDRYPFEINSKPYEIWYYNELNYRFLFVDQTGFGDYRLDPSTPIWNVRKREQ